MWVGYEMPPREYFGSHDPAKILAFSSGEAADEWCRAVPLRDDGGHRTVALCVIDSGVSG